MANTDSKNPIDLALIAVSKLFSGSHLATETYTDDSPAQLLELVNKLTSNTDNSPASVLIRMKTKDVKRMNPYGDLLEQLIKYRHLGVSGSIHSIVPKLINHQLNTGGKRNSIEEFTQSPDLKVGDIEIDSDDDRNKALNSLLNWAQLESYLDKPKTSFSRLAGGIRPLVYVFDDYSNFIERNDEGIFHVNEDLIYDCIAKFYSRSSSSQSRDLEDPIKGFCRCLNRLSLAFDVRIADMKFCGETTSPVMQMNGNRPNWAKLVADRLNFPKLDRERDRIAAFIIDLEWLPKPEWIKEHPDDRNWYSQRSNESEELGHIAVRLLSQRYPEIPGFIFTGMWSNEILQQSLAAGAAWCFEKPSTHHVSSTKNPDEELNYINLERHLTEFAIQNYGAYQQLPNPSQFDASRNSSLARELAEKMKMDLSLNECPKAKNFRSLIARQFTANTVYPVEMLSGGKSGALATFFARSTHDDNSTEATRFIKIDYWQNIQREYFAYQHIIRPTLNNYVAHVIQKPSVTLSSDSPALGAILSSLAGFPEDYHQLSTLQDLLNDCVFGKESIGTTCDKICSTLEFVLLPLYGNVQNQYFSLGEEFSPAFTGELIPLKHISLDPSSTIDPSPAIDSTPEIVEANKEIVTDKLITLKGWKLSNIWIDKDSWSELSIINPDSKYQIELNADSLDCQKRFSSLWLRLPIDAELIIKLDSDNTRLNNLRQEIERKGKLSIENLIDLWQKSNGLENIIDPFSILEHKFIFKGSCGKIHGDLNLNNILYPADEKTGFLIDFARAKKHGSIAFDLAWLEAQIWNYYLIPGLISLAKYIAPADSTRIIYQMLYLALKSSDFIGDGANFFNSQVKGIDNCQHVSSDLTFVICNSLKIIDSIRNFAREKLSIHINNDELKYALGVSFLRHSKFTIDTKHYLEGSDRINVLSYLAAAHYLSKLVSERVRSTEITLPDASKIEPFCQQYDIKRLVIFGSILREDFIANREIDIFVEFMTEETSSFRIFATMRDELSIIFNGLVDLRMLNELSDYFRDRVLSEAEIIYENLQQ